MTVIRWVERFGLFAVCLFFVAAVSTLAQLPTGTILGTVKDPSGAVMAGASVTARNVDTGITRTTPTEADGSYRFPALAAGNYEIEVSHEGFEGTKQSGITLTVGQEAVVNITLQIGSTTQTVQVTAEAPLVNTTNGTLGAVVNEQKVEDLPLNGRNYTELNFLQPGLTRLQGTGSVASIGSGDNFEFSSNGAPVRSNSTLLDGAPLVNLYGLSTGSVGNTTLGIDGIKEFSTVTNSFDAEYGLVMGSITTIVSKGGTDQFHGDVFEFVRNQALDAANFFDPTSIDFPGTRIAPLHRNQFGAAGGGPIKKDKTFVFMTYEGLRQVTGTPDILTTFPLNCYSATTHLLLTTANPCATKSAGNVAAVALPFLPFFHYPNLAPASAGGAPRFGTVFNSPFNENFGEIRIDENLSATDSFFGRYTIDDSAITTATDPPAESLGYAKAQFITLAETHIISPTLLNSVRFSVSSFPNHQPAIVAGFPNCAIINGPCVSNSSNPGTSIVCSTVYGAVSGTPPTGPGCLPGNGISVTGVTAPPGGGSGGPTIQEQDENTITGSDDLFWTKGKHSFKFGVLVNRYQMNINEEIGLDGSVTFTSAANFFAGLANAYSFLDPAHSDGRRYYRYFSYGVYAQDDIRLTPRLTVNLGLRYEPDTVPSEKYGHSTAFLHISTTDTVNSYVYGPPFRNPSLKNFSPRVGFAWDIFGNGKTALRGGFAELYDVGNIGSALIQQAIGLPPYNQAVSVTATSATTQIPITLPFLGAPAGYIPAIHAIDYYQRQPHMLQYNLSVERQLPGDIALTVSYTGSRGMDLWDEEDGDPHTPIPGSVTTWPVVGNTLFTPLFENPNLSTGLIFSTRGDSYYNSLQVSAIKRVSHNLQFQSAYTYSHSIDDWEAQIGTEGENTDPFDLGVDRVPSNWDIRHNWRFNAIYTLPDFVHQKVLGEIINGWRLSGIESLSTGFPFNPTMNSNTSSSGVGNDRPDWNPAFTGNLYPHTFGEWFNPAAFISPQADPTRTLTSATGPIGVLGNVGRNSLRGPGISNLDFSLSKLVKVGLLGEAGAVEFRVDSFNIFNHPNWGVPATSAAYNGTSVAGSAGLITATSLGVDSRRMQLSLKLLW